MRSRTARASKLAVFILACATAALTLSAQQQAPPAQPGPPAGRGGRAPEPAGPRVKALVVSGGCCHDYALQGKLLVDAISKSLPVDWTIAIQGGRGTRGELPVYDNPNWAKGFDIVVHNECLADVDDPAFIRRITVPQKGGPPALVIHCAMHTFRAATVDDWREFLGVTTKRHTKAHNISVKIAAKDHAIMKGFKEDWVTPVDELYVIEKFWPNSTALATAVSPEDQKEYPLAWVSDYGGTRVFGTTIGHGNDTWNDPVYQDLLVRAFKWALKRE